MVPPSHPDSATSAASRAAFADLVDGAHDRFDTARHLSIGIEEEFAICDPETLDLVSAFEELDVAARAAGLDEEVAGELLAAEIEFRTGANATWSEAADELREIRSRIARVAADSGYVLASSATHPWASYLDQSTIDTPYYSALVERMQYVTRRNNTFGLHVHVGVNGADRAIRVHDALRGLQPLLLALSTSSPFLDGEDTGLCSVRSMTFSRTFPRGNVAPAFGSMEGYVEHLRWLFDSGSINDVGQCWWGTRPHLRVGTVELRMFDGQPNVEHTLALAALAVGTVAHLCALDDAGELPPVQTFEQVDENMWRALRWGTDAQFVAAPSTRVEAPGAAIERLIEDARAAGRAAGLGIDAGLDVAAQMLDDGSSAVRQRRRFDAGEPLDSVYRAVVDETMTSASVRPVG